jgi:hypothetical protein
MQPIPGYPEYKISETGQVYRVGSVAPKATAPSKTGGYLQVNLWREGKGKTEFVHQLVAKTFHGPRPSPRYHAAHRDGDKKNNTPLNVQWITKEENEADKVLHGRSNRGERNWSAKVTDAQVLEIIQRAKFLPRSSGGKRLKKGILVSLASEYGMSRIGIWQIINGYRRQA